MKQYFTFWRIYTVLACWSLIGITMQIMDGITGIYALIGLAIKLALIAFARVVYTLLVYKEIK